MKETILAALSDGLHNEMHRAGIEHPHTESKIREYGSSYPALAIEIEYDEAVALSLFPIEQDHTFWLDRTFEIPLPATVGYTVRDEGYRIANSKPSVRTENVNVLDIVRERACQAHQWTMNINDIIIEVRERLAKAKAETAPLIDTLMPAYEAELQAANTALAERQAKKQAEEKAKAEAEAKAEEKFKAQSLAWAREHGSERLKKGMAKGYRCKQAFIREYCEQALGAGWRYDWNGNISTKDRSCPSLEALNLTEELEKDAWISDVRIVWLPKGYEELSEPEDIDPEAEGFEAIEAKFLGYYIYKRL